MHRNLKSIAGAQSELIAAAWLMEMGYEVFRNVAPCGPVDLVAWKEGDSEKYLIDVKTVNNIYTRQDGSETVPVLGGIDAEGIHCLVVSKGVVLGFYKRGAVGCGSDPYWPFKIRE